MTISQWEEFKESDYWREIKLFLDNNYKDICLNTLPHLNSDELERFQGKLEVYKTLQDLPNHIIKLKENGNG